MTYSSARQYPKEWYCPQTSCSFCHPSPQKKHTSRYWLLTLLHSEIKTLHVAQMTSQAVTETSHHSWERFWKPPGYLSHAHRHQNQHQNYHHHPTPHYPHWCRTSNIVMPRNLQSSFWSFWLNCSGASTSPPSMQFSNDLLWKTICNSLM